MGHELGILFFIHWKDKVRKRNGTCEYLVLSTCHPSISNYADILWLSPQEKRNNTTGAKWEKPRIQRLRSHSSFWVCLSQVLFVKDGAALSDGISRTRGTTDYKRGWCDGQGPSPFSVGLSPQYWLESHRHLLSFCEHCIFHGQASETGLN